MLVNQLTWLSIGLAAALGIAPGAAAQCAYEFVQVAPGFCASGSVHGRDLTNDEVVVGGYNGCPGSAFRAFRWSAQGVQVLPLPPGMTQAEAQFIAEDGTIAGTAWENINFLPNLTIWKTDGQVVYAVPGGEGTNTNRAVVRVDGAIFGEGTNYLRGVLCPYGWQDGRLIQLPKELSQAHGGIWSINAYGEMTGNRYETNGNVDRKAFVWSGDSVTILPVPDGAVIAWGEHIDNLHRVAGTAQAWPTRGDSPAPWKGFLWADGKFTMLGTLPGQSYSRPKRANSLGQVIGQSGPSNGIGGDAFFWQKGAMIPMVSLAAFPSGTKPKWANSINENGTILYTTVDGKSFLLRPLSVDEDIDLDCKVNFDDLVLLFTSWGDIASAPIARADVNRDGVIDAADIAEILGAWTP